MLTIYTFKELLNTNLPANPVRGRPQSIVFFCNFTVINNSLQLFHYTLVYVSLKASNKNVRVYVLTQPRNNKT